MHVTFSDVAVHLTEEEWRNLDRGQMQLYVDVMNDNYASLQSLGLAVPESDMFKCPERQKWDKSPFCEDGEQSYAPLCIDEASHEPCNATSPTPGSGDVQGENITGIEEGRETSDPSQNVLAPNQEQNSLASFRKKMLSDSSLQPKCQACNGILRCYCDVLKQNRKKPYACEDCGKAYQLQMYLLLHQKSHFQEHRYKCSMCEKSFDQHKVLQRHMKTHPTANKIQRDSQVTSPPKTQPGALYSCKQCQAVFPSKNLLKIHSKEHKKARSYSCLICGQVVQTYADLNTHLKGHKSPYRCTVCEKIYTNRPEFMAHLREHSGEQVYRCKICTKVYSRLVFLIKHMSVHISPAAGDHRLDEAFPKEERDHKPIRTIICGVSTKQEDFPAQAINLCTSTLQDDQPEEKYSVRHDSPIQFKQFRKRRSCQRCRKVFRYGESLRRHRQSHRVRFTCRRCGQVFRKLIRLYRHRFGHPNYRPYMCKHCNKTFSAKSLLLLHLATHDPAQLRSLYQCVYCRKVFRSQANCIDHQKTHVYKPPASPTFSDFTTFSNIQIAPFSGQQAAEKSPVREASPAKDYVKRLSYRPCV